MIIYHSGVIDYIFENHPDIVPNILLSVGCSIKELNKIDFNKHNIMLDSGAFTYLNKGISVDLDEWIERVKQYPLCKEVICLDVIDSGIKSLNNYKYIIKYLPHVIPTYHYGENISILDEYIKLGAVYVGIDGIARKGFSANKTTLNFLKNTMKYLFDKGYSGKTHLFGFTGLDHLLVYPFTSTDIASTKIAAGYGEIAKLRSTGRLTYTKINHLQGRGQESYIRRSIYNIKELNKYIDFINKIWDRRLNNE